MADIQAVQPPGGPAHQVRGLLGEKMFRHRGPGPGVRLVAWLTGCQFRCVFCHNPDTWKLTNGMPVPLKRALEVVNQYSHSLKKLKGGLTISGGEPLMQHHFLRKLFAEVHKTGVHTTLETNGFFGERLTDDDLANIDLVMIGIKAITPICTSA